MCPATPAAPAGRTAFFKIQGISLFACAVGRQEVRACTAKENTESEATFDTLPLYCSTCCQLFTDTGPVGWVHSRDRADAAYKTLIYTPSLRWTIISSLIKCGSVQSFLSFFRPVKRGWCNFFVNVKTVPGIHPITVLLYGGGSGWQDISLYHNVFKLLYYSNTSRDLKSISPNQMRHDSFSKFWIHPKFSS